MSYCDVCDDREACRTVGCRACSECQFEFVEVFDPAARGPIEVNQCVICGAASVSECQFENTQ